MQTQIKNRTGLSGNQLKIIALIAMTCDHVGLQLLPQFGFLRLIGRLALPIYAYMIAEGCRYTRNRRKYLGKLVLLAAACQIVYFVAMGSLYQCILVTFSLSICLIYAADRARETGKWGGATLAFLAAWALCRVVPELLPRTDFAIDYGIWGVLLPVLIYFGKTKTEKLLLLTAGLILLALNLGGSQWWALAAVPLLFLYNGRRGAWKIGNLFYIYYPAHLVVIYLISILL